MHLAQYYQDTWSPHAGKTVSLDGLPCRLRVEVWTQKYPYTADDGTTSTLTWMCGPECTSDFQCNRGPFNRRSVRPSLANARRMLRDAREQYKESSK